MLSRVSSNDSNVDVPSPQSGYQLTARSFSNLYGNLWERLDVLG